MDNAVTRSLTAKVGPLPAWAWGLGLGGVIVGVRAYRAHHSTPAPASGDSADGAGGEPGLGPSTVAGGVGIGDPGEYVPGSVGGYSPPSSYQSNPGGVITADGSESGSVDTGPLTDDEWRKEAFERLRARGTSTIAASTALTKYLNAQPLTAAEEAMIAYVLDLIGEPPGGAPAITRQADVTTTTLPPTPPASAVPPTPAPPQKWVKPAYLAGQKFVKGSGPAVYQVTDTGLEWVPSEPALYALGGGGTIQLPGGGSYTYGGNPTGIPPLVIPDNVLNGLPKIGAQPE